jgi:hypothetical protein
MTPSGAASRAAYHAGPRITPPLPALSTLERCSGCVGEPMRWGQRVVGKPDHHLLVRQTGKQLGLAERSQPNGEARWDSE